MALYLILSVWGEKLQSHCRWMEKTRIFHHGWWIQVFRLAQSDQKHHDLWNELMIWTLDKRYFLRIVSMAQVTSTQTIFTCFFMSGYTFGVEQKTLSWGSGHHINNEIQVDQMSIPCPKCYMFADERNSRCYDLTEYEQIHRSASGMLAPRGSFTNRKQSDYSSNWNGIFRLMPNSLIRLCGGFNAPNTFEWFSDFNFQLFFPHFNIALSILFAWNSTQMKWFIPIWISYFRLCAKLAQPIRNACMRTGKKMDPSIFRSITFSNLDI